MNLIISSIEKDISSIEERTVITLMQALGQLEAFYFAGRRSSSVSKLAAHMHNVVANMAIENAELVDVNFMIDYLHAIKS